jgi:hypothetical protein
VYFFTNVRIIHITGGANADASLIIDCSFSYKAYTITIFFIE